MTRIIAGLAGGRRLHTPAGADTRPTTGRVREALFSSLGDITGLSVLDLYAGSGALGLEALSRGAARATFVEQSVVAVRALRRNVDELAFSCAHVVMADVGAFLSRSPDPVDLVLADPPYAAAVDAMLAAVVPWVTGTVVVERATRSGPLTWPAGLAATRQRTYGDTSLWYGHSP